MTDHPALAWNKLIIDTGILGRRMRILSEAIKADPSVAEEYDALAGIYEEDPAELATILRGISTALKIIGETPNAYLNTEGLDALRSKIERARLIDRESSPILDRIDPL